MSSFKEILEIGGVEYTFIANRKTRIDFNDLFKTKTLKINKNNVKDIMETFSTNDMLDMAITALLKQTHNLSLKEASNLRLVALTAEEYGDKFDIFINALFEKTTVIGEKTIDFLEKRD